MNIATLKFIVKTIVVLVLAAIAAGLLYWLFAASRWDWIQKYYPLLLSGLWQTILLWVLSCIFGMILAIPIGLVQVTGPRWLGAVTPLGGLLFLAGWAVLAWSARRVDQPAD